MATSFFDPHTASFDPDGARTLVIPFEEAYSLHRIEFFSILEGFENRDNGSRYVWYYEWENSPKAAKPTKDPFTFLFEPDAFSVYLCADSPYGGKLRVPIRDVPAAVIDRALGDADLVTRLLGDPKVAVKDAGITLTDHDATIEKIYEEQEDSTADERRYDFFEDDEEFYSVPPFEPIDTFSSYDVTTPAHHNNPELVHRMMKKTIEEIHHAICLNEKEKDALASATKSMFLNMLADRKKYLESTDDSTRGDPYQLIRIIKKHSLAEAGEDLPLVGINNAIDKLKLSNIKLQRLEAGLQKKDRLITKEWNDLQWHIAVAVDEKR